MTLTRKILSTLLAFVAIGIVSLAVALSYDASCGAAPALPENATVMKAVVYRCYGSPDVLHVEQIEKPTPEDDQVLVRVHSASINPLDFHYMTGTPYIMRIDGGFGAPKVPRLGVDFAGTVEAVGPKVQRFKPGDAVFGARFGSFAEYVAVRENRIAPKPANVTFEQAAAVPVAALTALQGLRDSGQLRAGQKVLVNGASGGVGTFAVQIAKALGAEVTGVCSTRNVDMVRSLGADHVVDYTKQNFTQGDARYDVILDNIGNHPLLAYRRVMKPDGTYVMIGGPKTDKWLGPLGKAAGIYVIKPFVSQKYGLMLSEMNGEDMAFLVDLMESGKVTPIIDRRYTLDQIRDAMRYLSTGRARAKVVITVQGDGRVVGTL
jgi:NADPH:quinone reductase-like Zn-dependent oxidoreductase